MKNHALRNAVAKALRGGHRTLAWEEISASRRLYWIGIADICLTAIEIHNRENSMASKFVQRIHDIGAVAWLRFVQSLNWIAVSLFGSIAVVHQYYPGVIGGLISKLPPTLGIPAIFAFGLLVHYALRRSIKAV